ncbi:MAG TPA: hypothetical protein VHU19_01535 [Pyrinomonadaceae bacterium]|jgi:chromosome segregation ATPase|nr:hypothetical protein [Pyrinomonadaceae bacterium]
MSNEEVERAIDFVLKSQADLDARIEQTNQQIAETDRQLAETNKQLAKTSSQVAATSSQLAETNGQLAATNGQLNDFADMQSQFIQVLTRTFEAQAHINESLRAGLYELTAKQSRTEDALAQLAEAHAHADRRLDTLIDIVQGGRNGQ